MGGTESPLLGEVKLHSPLWGAPRPRAHKRSSVWPSALAVFIGGPCRRPRGEETGWGTMGTVAGWLLANHSQHLEGPLEGNKKQNPCD